MGGIFTYMQEVWSNCINIFFEEKVKMQKWLLTGAFPLYTERQKKLITF